MTIAASPGQLVIEPDHQFILTNEGNKELRFTYNRRTWIIPAGEHRVVPFDVVRLYFGDPRSVVGTQQKYQDSDGNNGDIPKREAEIRRLCVFYGLYAGNEAKLPDHPSVQFVKIQTVDQTEIFCPAVDPDGQISYAHREADDTLQNRDSMLRLMQQRLEQQQAQIDALRGISHEEDEGEAGIDAPRFPS
jgi:hypothetical protein